MGNVQSNYPIYYNVDPTSKAKTHALSGYPDLASKAIGGSIIKASNEKFGSAKNLIKAHFSSDSGTASNLNKNDYKHSSALFNSNAWVTRRHNKNHDWVIIKLGNIGTIAGFGIDTRGLTHDAAIEVSIEACLVPEELEAAHKSNPDELPLFWEPLLPKVDISPNSIVNLALWNETKTVYNYVKVNIFPDGGLSRIHIYGTVAPLLDSLSHIDLACVSNGGMVVASSDDSLGKKENLILPGYTHLDGCHGWVTKRKQKASLADQDWALVKLSEAGHLKKAVIETIGLDGVEPSTAALYACRSENTNPDFPKPINWYKVSSDVNIEANKSIPVDLNLSNELFTHVKLVISPDGGISRLRVFGEYERPESQMDEDETIEGDINAKPEEITAGANGKFEPDNEFSDFVDVSKIVSAEPNQVTTPLKNKKSKKRSQEITQIPKQSPAKEETIPAQQETEETAPPSKSLIAETSTASEPKPENEEETKSIRSGEPSSNHNIFNRVIATPKRPSSKRPIILQSPIDRTAPHNTKPATFTAQNNIPITNSSSAQSPSEEKFILVKKSKKTNKDDSSDHSSIPAFPGVKKSNKSKKNKKALKSQQPE